MKERHCVGYGYPKYSEVCQILFSVALIDRKCKISLLKSIIWNLYNNLRTQYADSVFRICANNRVTKNKPTLENEVLQFCTIKMAIKCTCNINTDIYGM